jgi:FkbM family methyltransferase
MRLKHTVKALYSSLLQILLLGKLPHGLDIFQDIAKHLPGYRPGVIFDAGANEGQSAAGYLRRFPEARIYCFEPVRETFQRLQRCFKKNPRVSCFQLALGASEKTGQMVLQGSSEEFFLLRDPEPLQKNPESLIETVSMITLEEFCAARKIHRIHYLKIDTEGADLEVLKGASKLLAAQKIDFVQVEAGMHPGNDRHVPLESLKAFLELHGYFLFGIYDQVHEWPAGAPNLRRTNPVFISRQLVQGNKKYFTGPAFLPALEQAAGIA